MRYTVPITAIYIGQIEIDANTPEAAKAEAIRRLQEGEESPCLDFSGYDTESIDAAIAEECDEESDD